MARKPNPLYIRIPRTIPKGLEDRWDIVRRCNGSRRAMVNFICGIGGYIDGHDRFAIEFNVKAYGADTSEENLWKMLSSGEMDLGPDATLPAGEQAAVKALFSRVYKEHEDYLWDWGQEEAYEGWRDSDTPYETWLGERVEWKMELRGRSGGHLVMTECEGINLKCSEEDLEATLMEADTPHAMDFVPAETIRKLFIICVQNSVELTSKKAAEEIEYRAAWRLWSSFMEDQIPAMLEAYRNRQQLGSDAAYILRELIGTGNPEARDAFVTICTLADINIED
jgi:hypothetical protein